MEYASVTLDPLRHMVGVVLVTCSGGSHLGFIYRKKVQTDGV